MNGKRPRAKTGTGINLRPIEREALRYLAKRDGHGNAAPVVRKLIDAQMRSELGGNWEQVLQTILAGEPSGSTPT